MTTPEELSDEAEGPPAPPTPAVVPSFGLPPTRPAPPTYDPSRLMRARRSARPLAAGFYAPVRPAPADESAESTEPRVSLVGDQRGLILLVLSVVLGVMLVLTGVLSALYATTNREASRRADEVAALEADKAQLLAVLQAAKAEQADTQAYRDCVQAYEALVAALDESGGESTPAVASATRTADAACLAAAGRL